MSEEDVESTNAITIETGRNTERADKIIAWIERWLKVTIASKNTRVGDPYILADFQKAFIRDVYEPYDVATPDSRLVTKAVFSVGRKNGKTDLAAALCLVHLIGPESVMNGSIVSGAKTKKQARLLFEAMVRFLNLAPTLKRSVRIVDSMSRIAVVVSGKRCSGSTYQAIAADDGAAQGHNPSMIVMDELAQANDDGKFYKALEVAGKARGEPFTMVISTQAADPNHILSRMIRDGLSGADPRNVAHLYAAEEGARLDDVEAQRAANPAMGLWLSSDLIMKEAMEAIRDPVGEAHFRLFTLNQQVNLFATLMPRADWEASLMDGPEVKDRWQRPEPGRWAYSFEPKEPIYLGLDMSSTTDLTALIGITAGDETRMKAWFWKPSHDLQKASERDGLRYDLYADRGWLQVSPGRVIEPALVIAQIALLMETYDVRGLAYDRRFMAGVLAEFAKGGIDAGPEVGRQLRVVPWGQGHHADMTSGINAILTSALTGKLQHDGNPLLTSNVMNAIVLPSATDMKMFVKDEAVTRIDGAVAAAMACGLKARDMMEPVVRSPWDDESYSLIQPEPAAG